MKKIVFLGAAAALVLSSCNPTEEMHTETAHTDFQWQVDRFADIKVLRYQIPSWDDLNPQQRIYAYHLTQAGLAGRDIMWDCNYRHNLEIRKALEAILSSDGVVDREGQQYADFEVYAKRVFFANGIHHHYSNMKFAVSYKIVTVAGEAGDATPATPIGVNLPNANWIRVEHGSKSVSLGNIEDAYHASAGKGMAQEFGFSTMHNERAEKYGELGSKMHTALHEVVGHASGKINPGVGTPKQTMKNYSSTLEEARADLVALYFIVDDKMQEIGLMENKEPGYAEYDNYMSNGMMLQLRRILPGDDIEEDHMRNRQLVASWAFERGREENVVERKVIDGKTYFVVNDYDKLRGYFGELLREIQRIKMKVTLKPVELSWRPMALK